MSWKSCFLLRLIVRQASGFVLLSDVLYHIFELISPQFYTIFQAKIETALNVRQITVGYCKLEQGNIAHWKY